MVEAPRVFVSHASEDKGRFVEEFATNLRSTWVDAWVDQWEMTPGDSLVDGIFERGIGSTIVFVAVVSRVSLTKPWVKEELAVAIERSISENYKIIPVLLDGLERADLPVALRHKIWVSHSGDMAATVAEVKAGVFSTRSSKPPLGGPRSYLNRPDAYVPLVDNPLDDRVLEAILDSLSQFDGTSVVFLTSDLSAALQRDEDISIAEFDESMHALVQQRALDAKQMLHAPGRWLLGAIPARTWLARARQRGIDVDAIQYRLAIDVINSESQRYSAETIEGLDPWTTQAIFNSLGDTGYVTSITTADGTNHLSNPSPLLKRWAENRA